MTITGILLGAGAKIETLYIKTNENSRREASVIYDEPSLSVLEDPTLDSVFQFQYGSTESYADEMHVKAFYAFQFQYGSTESPKIVKMLEAILQFQFQYGSTESDTACVWQYCYV